MALYSEGLAERARKAAAALPAEDRAIINELADRHLILLAQTLQIERTIHNIVKESERG